MSCSWMMPRRMVPITNSCLKNGIYSSCLASFIRGWSDLRWYVQDITVAAPLNGRSFWTAWWSAFCNNTVPDLLAAGFGKKCWFSPRGKILPARLGEGLGKTGFSLSRLHSGTVDSVFGPSCTVSPAIAAVSSFWVSFLAGAVFFGSTAWVAQDSSSPRSSSTTPDLLVVPMLGLLVLSGGEDNLPQTTLPANRRGGWFPTSLGLGGIGSLFAGMQFTPRLWYFLGALLGCQTDRPSRGILCQLKDDSPCCVHTVTPTVWGLSGF